MLARVVCLKSRHRYSGIETMRSVVEEGFRRAAMEGERERERERERESGT
jgi:hypothetical protein